MSVRLSRTLGVSFGRVADATSGTAGPTSLGSENFGLPCEAIAEGKDAGLQVVGPREVADEVSEEQLPVEGEGEVERMQLTYVDCHVVVPTDLMILPDK